MRAHGVDATVLHDGRYHTHNLLLRLNMLQAQQVESFRLLSEAKSHAS